MMTPVVSKPKLFNDNVTKKQLSHSAYNYDILERKKHPGRKLPLSSSSCNLLVWGFLIRFGWSQALVTHKAFTCGALTSSTAVLVLWHAVAGEGYSHEHVSHCDVDMFCRKLPGRDTTAVFFGRSQWVLWCWTAANTCFSSCLSNVHALCIHTYKIVYFTFYAIESWLCRLVIFTTYEPRNDPGLVESEVCDSDNRK